MSVTGKIDPIGAAERNLQAQILERAKRARCPDHPEVVPVVTLASEVLSGRVAFDVASPCCAKIEAEVREAALKAVYPPSAPAE